MNEQSPPTESNDSRLKSALRGYLECVDRGDPIDRDAFLAKHADVAEQLRSLLDAEEDIRRLAGGEIPKQTAEDSTRSFVDRGHETVVPEALNAKIPATHRVGKPLSGDFGRYRILRSLGHGAMGTVYLAEDTQLGREVAIKTPHFDKPQPADVLERLYREARAAAALRHPNICPVYDVGAIDGTHYISMAYIDGRALSAFIRGHKRQSERDILTVIRRLALALQEAHQHTIVHRDLKPANIMIDARGEPIIMDFGLARQALGEDDIRLTQTGALLGSPAYMSPEQIDFERGEVGPASDQYSLGVVFYELLTGQLPFRGTIVKVMASILTTEPTPPSQLREDLNPRIEAACLRMMAKRSSDRFPDMAAVADELLAVRRTLDGQTSPIKKPKRAPVADYSTPADVVLSRSEGGAPQPEAASDASASFARLIRDSVVQTGTRPRATSAKTRGRRRLPKVLAAGLATCALIAGGVIILLQSGTTTLRIEINDPGVEVTVQGSTLRIQGPAENEITIKPGENRLAITLDGSTFASDGFSIQKGSRQIVRISRDGPALDVKLGGRLLNKWLLKPARVSEGDGERPDADAAPPLLSAPFEESAAKQNQRQWGAFLKQPVERLNSIGMKLVLIPPGDFRMGAGAQEEAAARRLDTAPSAEDGIAVERPQHKVRISRPFYLSAHEVTRAQFARFVKASSDRSESPRAGDNNRAQTDAETQPANLPVADVSWNDAHAFCDWLGHVENRSYRLPSEAEWEYACRAGTTTLFSSGDGLANFAAVANTAGLKDNAATLAPVGSFKSNPFGLFDMHGNVLEWCQDWMNWDYYANSPQVDPRGPPQGEFRLFRGGSGNLSPIHARSAARRWQPPAYRFADLGFRVALDINAPAAALVGAIAGTPEPIGISTSPLNESALEHASSAQVPVVAAPVKKEPPSGKDGFVSLFNGADLSGWKIDGAGSNSWHVEDGAIVARGRLWDERTYLLSDRDYGDFVLRFEFNLERGADTGLAIRAIPGEQLPHGPRQAMRFDHPALRICDDSAKTIKTGTLIWVVGDRNDATRPVKLHPNGRWNQVEIELSGKVLRVSINGMPVINAPNGDDVAGNKAYIPGLKRVTGRIGFQNQGGTARFRFIEIKELSATNGSRKGAKSSVGIRSKP